MMTLRRQFVAFTAILLEVVTERISEPGLFSLNGSAHCDICRVRRRRLILPRRRR